MKLPLALASHNHGKIKEIKHSLGDLDVCLTTLGDLNLPTPEEPATTYVENALIKAHHMAQHVNMAVIADDSGIEISALDGEPGVHSAYYAGPNAKPSDNIARMILELKNRGVTRSAARMVCVIVLLHSRQDATPAIFTGTWQGEVMIDPMGDVAHQQLPYGPYLYDCTHQQTIAQMTHEQRAAISHRGQALAKLRDYLSNLAPSS